MTLPGIAGMILTIGVAADANVVIFERIKEEVRARRSVTAAISPGYAKGFRTIIDANVVTLITAAVLFIAGTGTRQGLRLHAGRRRARLDVHGRRSRRAPCSACSRGFNVVQQRRLHGRHGAAGALAASTSSAAQASGSRSPASSSWSASARSPSQGLNHGIDFKGGTRITATLGQPRQRRAGRRRASEAIDPKLGRRDRRRRRRDGQRRPATRVPDRDQELQRRRRRDMR